jgi:hypothetical protein
MSGCWPNQSVTLEYLAATIAKQAPSRDLHDCIRVIVRHCKHSKTFGAEEAEPVLDRLLDLLNADNAQIEEELLDRNSPPPVPEIPQSQHFFWAVISFALFMASPKVSPGFAKEVINRCLRQITNMAFALVHSESVAWLARDHPECVNRSFAEVVIAGSEDSRCLYALRVARWIPDWRDLGRTVFRALLSAAAPKNIEAMWVLNHRSTFEEVLSLVRENHLKIPASIAQCEDLRLLTKAILNQSQSAPYLVKLQGTPSADEVRHLSDLLRNLFGPESNT